MLKTPEYIEKRMKVWRQGLISLPQSYIDFHATAAEIDMHAQGFTVLEDHGLVGDGWLDGMKVRELLVALKGKEGWQIKTIRWHESGAWFIGGAGWSRGPEMTEGTREALAFFDKRDAA